MYNTIGEVAVTNTFLETNNFPQFVQFQKWKILVFPQPQYVFNMILNFGYFLASRLYKKVLIKQKRV